MKFLIIENLHDKEISHEDYVKKITANQYRYSQHQAFLNAQYLRLLHLYVRILGKHLR